ncbi:ABC transporter permease [Streptomyces sp. WAC06614]|uniref:ABC transporter permease n=1 Tax=Streptomyces sp. WAC06614 TaxID=2487416 RepID=UPI000F7AACED|nr:ABC transporter permease [Streptomyces sp. WAC06614]RSS79391.1 ABC transporter permease [Streptomyces sp. WAC06614]
MFRTALRNVLAHKTRLLMTVLAVMLGVAFVSGTFVFTDTVGKAMSDQSRKSYDGIAVSLSRYGPVGDAGGAPQGRGEPGISRQTLDRIGKLNGVDSVTGQVSGFAGVADRDGKLIGSGWTNRGTNYAPGKDGKDPRYTFTQGHGPVKDDEVALDRASATAGGYRVGERIRVATDGPVKEYTLSGVFTTEDGQVNAGGSLVLFDTAVAQTLYLRPGYYSEATVAARPGTSADTLLSEIKPVVGKDVQAETGAALAERNAKAVEEGMSGLKKTLLAFGLVSLFVSIFLIYNTFTMLVAQRTKELALLRAVGATRGQVRRSVLAEASVVGVVASAVGLGVGVGLAVALRSALNGFGAKLPAGPLVVSPTAVTTALAVGIVVTVLAAWLPARRTARIAPVAALGSAHLPAAPKSLMVLNSVGGLMTAVGSALVVYGSAGGDERGRWLIGGGAFLALIGVTVLIPLLSRPMIAAVRPLLGLLFGVAGTTAARNAVRNPRRTGVTAGMLTIGLTLVTCLTVLGVTLAASVDRSTTDQIRADYTLTMAGGGTLDPSVVTALERTPGVTAVSGRQNAYLTDGKGGFDQVSGVNPAAIDELVHLKVVSGSLGSLAQGRVAVAQKTARKAGLAVGSTFEKAFQADGRKRTFTVGAVFDGNDVLAPYVLDARQIPLGPGGKPFLTQVFVKTAGGESPADEQRVVDALGGNPAIKIADRQELRHEMGGVVDTMLNLLYGLLGMALIIAVLGVVNTLAMSVFERTQEIGMLRAIGLDRGRVRTMIRLEAVVISLFGAVLGVGLGTFLAWAVGRSVRSNIPHYALVIPYARIGVFLLLAGIVGVLAALWPARSAAKLNMLTAIKTE